MSKARAVGQVESAIANWGREVRTITGDGCGLAKEILAEESENYTQVDLAAVRRGEPDIGGAADQVSGGGLGREGQL